MQLFKVPPADISIDKIHKEYETLEEFSMKDNLDLDNIDAETNMKKHKKGLILIVQRVLDKLDKWKRLTIVLVVQLKMKLTITETSPY